MVPKPVKQAVRAGIAAWCRTTSSLRVLPDFLIVGAQKAGTTALYANLEKHPCVVRAIEKETYFFAWNFRRGLSWYRSHFPTRRRAAACRQRHGGFATGEATPYYLYHPCSPMRAKQVLPEAKIIAMLRNPVDRAYSHYQHVRDLGLEPAETFEEALRRESERLGADHQRFREDPDYCSHSHWHFSYVARGMYAEQLERWFEAFGRERVAVTSLDDFKADWKGSFVRTMEFLELPPWDPPEFTKVYSREYDAMSPATRRDLIETFRPHNKRLYALLGRDLLWDR